MKYQICFKLGINGVKTIEAESKEEAQELFETESCEPGYLDDCDSQDFIEITSVYLLIR